METAHANPVDVFVGQQIRTYRIAAGLNQSQLAKSVGVTFQQLQKYENAMNRVSASRLFGIAKTLGRPVAAFFPADDDEALAATEFNMSSLVPLRPHWLELDTEQRKLMIDMARALAKSSRD